MISAGDFKKGITIELDGQVWSIVDFQHVKPGKGAAFVRTKIKNVVTGAVLERTFSPTGNIPRRASRKRTRTYAVPLQRRASFYYFMDTETYEQLPLNRDMVESALPFIKENMDVQIKPKGEAFSVDLPNFVELAKVETDPGFRGDSCHRRDETGHP